jgi:hypothetical protein
LSDKPEHSPVGVAQVAVGTRLGARMPPSQLCTASPMYSNATRPCILQVCIVTSDSLGCFAALTEAECVHAQRAVGALKPRQLPKFK